MKKYYTLKRNIVIDNNKLLRSKTLIMKHGTKIYKRTLFTEEFVESLNLKPKDKKLFIPTVWDDHPKTGDIKEQIVESHSSTRELYKDEYGNIIVQKSDKEVEILTGKTITKVDNTKLEKLNAHNATLEETNKKLLSEIEKLKKGSN